MIHNCTQKHKFRKFCRKLRKLISSELIAVELVAVGILERLWHTTIVSTPEGDIGKISNEDIADEVGWYGDADELIFILIECGWIDESEEHRLVIHDWHDHAPKFLKGNLRSHGKDFVTVAIATCPEQPAIADCPKQAAQSKLVPNITKPNQTQPNQTQQGFGGLVAGEPVAESALEADPLGSQAVDELLMSADSDKWSKLHTHLKADCDKETFFAVCHRIERQTRAKSITRPSSVLMKCVRDRDWKFSKEDRAAAKQRLGEPPPVKAKPPPGTSRQEVLATCPNPECKSQRKHMFDGTRIQCVNCMQFFKPEEPNANDQTKRPTANIV